MKRISVVKVLAAIACCLTAATANAQVVTYSGFDLGASTLGPNSIAAQTSFRTATGGSIGINFESALPAGVSRVGGTIRSVPSCAANLCGFNTTIAGANYLEGFGGTVTFTFGSGINYFGGYFSGLQLLNRIEFNDGSSQLVNMGFDAEFGGMGFAGFTDFNKLITSVTVNLNVGSNGDIAGIDDIIYGTKSASTTTPEPGTYAMLLVGFGMIGVVARRRRA